MMGTDELHFVKGADNTITNLRHKEKSKHTNKYARQRGEEDDNKPKMKPLIDSKFIQGVTCAQLRTATF